MTSDTNSLWTAPALTNPTNSELIGLATALWDWPPCHEPNLCTDSMPCKAAHCTRQKITGFQLFTSHYRLLTLSYNPQADCPALKTHGDLLSLVSALRRNPDLRKSQIARDHFRDGQDTADRSQLADEDCAMNLAMTLMTMINCIAQGTSAILLEEGSNRTPWRWEVSPSQHVSLLLPRKNSMPPRYGEEPMFLDISSPLLMARELKRLAGMEFRGTNDITNHLRYDPINNVLSIFHHTSFLKEQLRLSRNCSRDASVGEYLKSGALPRQYIIECLYTIQRILFPLWDSKSVALLQSLVKNSAFDPDILDSQDVSFIADDEEKIPFSHLGGRLAELYEELQNPRPRGWLAGWLERRSGARYVMLATVAGVAFAILLGMAGLAISAYQAWVGYQAWQRPVQPV